MGDSNITRNAISARRGLAMMDGQARSTDLTDTARRRGPTRAAAPCLPTNNDKRSNEGRETDHQLDDGIVGGSVRF